MPFCGVKLLLSLIWGVPGPELFPLLAKTTPTPVSFSPDVQALILKKCPYTSQQKGQFLFRYQCHPKIHQVGSQQPPGQSWVFFLFTLKHFLGALKSV